MEKAIRKNRTVSMQRMAEVLAKRLSCTEGEATDALVNALLSKSEPGGKLVLYDAGGTGFATALSPERAESRFYDLFNSHWWTRPDREQVRQEWDRWRIPEKLAPVLFRLAAENLGSPRLFGGLSEMTEEARRGVSDREDNLLTAVPSAAPGYLDPSHPRYSPKLAAAVRAWLAVDDPKGKHPKQALTAWLTKNASNFGLTNPDGRPNKEGIGDCAKVANWKPSGGAPTTPGK
jgi:hypothetical protein